MSDNANICKAKIPHDPSSLRCYSTTSIEMATSWTDIRESGTHLWDMSQQIRPGSKIKGTNSADTPNYQQMIRSNRPTPEMPEAETPEPLKVREISETSDCILKCWS